jgi:hypothetical protein
MKRRKYEPDLASVVLPAEPKLIPIHTPPTPRRLRVVATSVSSLRQTLNSVIDWFDPSNHEHLSWFREHFVDLYNKGEFLYRDVPLPKGIILDGPQKKFLRQRMEFYIRFILWKIADHFTKGPPHGH